MAKRKPSTPIAKAAPRPAAARPARSRGAGSRRESPRSAARILQILEHLSDRSERWSLSALSREMHAPKSSLLVLLRALIDMKHVSHVDGAYQLEAASFQLATRILSNRRFPEVARPILQQIVEETGETVVIGALSEDGMSTVYIDKVESPSALRFSATIGFRRPLYSSASGHVLLAFGSEKAFEAYMKDVTITPLTASTIKTKQELKQAIKLARERGVAVTRDQSTQGVTGFGAPIYDETGRLIGSLVLAAPSARIENKIDELSALAKKAATMISDVMGFREARS